MATVPGPQPDKPAPIPGAPGKEYPVDPEEEPGIAEPDREEEEPSWMPQPYDPEKETEEPGVPLSP